MSAYNIGCALCEPPDVYDDSERVAERIAEMSRDELRDLSDYSRGMPWQAKRRPSQKFSEWLREHVSTQLAKEDRESFYD